MEQANLETKLHFILEDMTDRFAVIGMMDHFEESLSMFETVRVEKINYSIKIVEYYKRAISGLFNVIILLSI